jgi:hypothetical protein
VLLPAPLGYLQLLQLVLLQSLVLAQAAAPAWAAADGVAAALAAAAAAAAALHVEQQHLLLPAALLQAQQRQLRVLCQPATQLLLLSQQTVLFPQLQHLLLLLQ